MVMAEAATLPTVPPPLPPRPLLPPGTPGPVGPAGLAGPPGPPGACGTGNGAEESRCWPAVARAGWTEECAEAAPGVLAGSLAAVPVAGPCGWEATGEPEVVPLTVPPDGA
jgi:hypothetical protein